MVRKRSTLDESTLLQKKDLGVDFDVALDTPRASSAKGPAIGWLGWLLTMAALLLGLFGGGFVGAVGLYATGLGAVVAPSPPVPDPVLRVLAPPGIEVQVDDVVVDGQTTVRAGEPVRVALSGKGYQGSEMTLTLDAGEVRVLLVTAQATEPESR
mgnify:CR=1 FL=1